VSLENPFAGQGAVMLDIGGNVGALIVEMPAGLDGVEVEIRPQGVMSEHDHDGVHGAGGNHRHRGAHHAHVAVVSRPTGEGLMPWLVFPELLEGTYELYVKPDGEVRLVAAVQGGTVAYATLAQVR